MIAAYGRILFMLLLTLALSTALTACGDDDDDDADTGDLSLLEDDDADDDADDDTADDDTDDDADDDTGVELESVSLDPAALSLAPGVERTVTATAHWSDGSETTEEDFFFSSGDAGVFTVDQDGLVAGVASGEANLTVTLSGVQAQAAINVGLRVFFFDGTAGTIGAYDPESGDVVADYLAAKDALATVPADLVIDQGIAYLLESGDYVTGTTGTEGYVTVDLATKETGGLVIDDLDNPWSIRVVDGTAYITGNLSNDLVVVDIAAETAESVSLPTDCVPTGLHVEGEKVYVACSGYDPGTFSYADPGVVAIVDLENDTTDTVDTTRINPTGFVRGNDDDLYIVCTGNFVDELGVVDVLDLTDDTIGDSIDVGSAPGPGALHSNGRVFLPNGLAGQVLYFDSDTEVVGTPIALTDALWASTLGIDPVTGNVLVGDWTNQQIWVLDADTFAVVDEPAAMNSMSPSFWIE